VSPKHPRTESQRGVWGNMTDLSALWNDQVRVGEPRRVKWRELAEAVKSRPNLTQSGKLTGRLLFIKLNSVLLTCGREVLLDPPPAPIGGSTPVTGFTIERGKGGPVFKLKGPPEVWRARLMLGDIMVYAWAPYNAGADGDDLYAFLGVLGPAEGGEGDITEWDITEMYMRKLREWRKLKPKRYHVPLEGAKVYIRVWPQVNGWVDELSEFRGWAFVPGKGEGRRQNAECRKGTGMGRGAGKRGHQ